MLATLDQDSELHIFDEGLKQLEEFKPLEEVQKQHSEDDMLSIPRMDTGQRALKRTSMWIGNVMVDADWDDDGQIDYEEFLRALHPRFNEAPVTPTAVASGDLSPQKFWGKDDDEKDDTGKSVYDRFLKQKSDKQSKSANVLSVEKEKTNGNDDGDNENDDGFPQRAGTVDAAVDRVETMVIVSDGDLSPMTPPVTHIKAKSEENADTKLR